MIDKKDYVSYKIAKQLKEDFDFDEECVTMFNGCDHIIYTEPTTNSKWDKYLEENYLKLSDIKGWYTAPTLAAVHKWLRLEMGVNIIICTKKETDGSVSYKCKFDIIDEFMCGGLSDFKKSFPTYEDALTAGIEKAINFLK